MPRIMKTKSLLPILPCALLAVALFTGCSSMSPTASDPKEPNTLTAAEKAEGWRLLFNGTNFDGWHNFKMDTIRPGWQVTNDMLVCVDPHNAGDIVTTDKFEWFELQL